MENTKELFNDEELGIDDVVGVGEDIVQESNNPSSAPVVVNAEHAAVENSGLTFDMSAFKGIAGVTVAEVGTVISRFAVEKARFTVQSKARISPITDQIIVIKTHFSEVQGLGSFICFGGQCCRHEGIPTVRYIVPIVRYDTNKKGAPISREIKNQVWVIGQNTYEALMDLKEINGTITGIDLLVTCTDEVYQKLTLMPAGKANWTRVPSVRDKVAEFWKKNMENVLQPVARPITEQEYLKKINESGGDVAFKEPVQASDLSYDEVFK